jgi:hypothetical protein
MGPSQFDHEKLEGFVVLQRIEPGKAMLVRVVAMLTKLLERFDPEQFRVRESPSDSVLQLIEIQERLRPHLETARQTFGVIQGDRACSRHDFGHRPLLDI